MKQKSQRIIAGCCALALLWQALPAQAAVLTPADREQQNAQLREAAEARREREKKRDVFLQEPKREAEEAALPEEAVSFPIARIVLEGAPPGKFTALAAALRRYENRRIGMAGIREIIRRGNARLIDGGFITSRLTLGEQDLSSGTLRLRLLPGRIHAIRFADPAARANWRTAFAARPGDVLNLRDLEQGLEQLKRVRSREADFQIVPAETPGESDIVVALNQGKRVHLTLSVDDSGSEATGKRQLAAYLTVDNLCNANDILRIGRNGDGDRAGDLLGTQGGSVSYSVPYGDWTFTLGTSSYRYHQTVAASVNALEFSGTSKAWSFGVERLLARDQRSKTHLELGLACKNNRSYVDDTEISIQRRKSTDFSLGLAHRRYIGPALLDVRLSHRLGVPWFRAQSDPAAAVAALPTLRYHIWNLDGAYLRPVVCPGGLRAQYRCSFAGQLSNDRLYAADCLSIGNRYTVRGFDGEQTLLGERGFYVQNELSFPLAKSEQQFFVGIDYGRVGGPSSDPAASRALWGAAAGFRGPIGGAQYEVFVGWPLSKPDTLHTAAQTYGFQLICEL